MFQLYLLYYFHGFFLAGNKLLRSSHVVVISLKEILARFHRTVTKILLNQSNCELQEDNKIRYNEFEIIKLRFTRYTFSISRYRYIKVMFKVVEILKSLKRRFDLDIAMLTAVGGSRREEYQEHKVAKR